MEQPLGRRLALTHRVVHEAIDRRLAEHGASLWNWVLLREASTADGASQRELAALMGIEPPTLVRHLDKLAADGFVERRRDPDDRRVARVVVTPAGRKRNAELSRVAQQFDAELRSLLSERELDVLRAALTRIHEHFTEEMKPSRARRAGGEAESTVQEEMKPSRARRAGGEAESTIQEVASGRS